MRKKIIIGLLCGITIIGIMSYNSVGGKCTGSKYCSACKNCKYCKHCAKDGGKCGVCRK